VLFIASPCFPTASELLQKHFCIFFRGYWLKKIHSYCTYHSHIGLDNTLLVGKPVDNLLLAVCILAWRTPSCYGCSSRVHTGCWDFLAPAKESVHIHCSFSIDKHWYLLNKATFTVPVHHLCRKYRRWCSHSYRDGQWLWWIQQGPVKWLLLLSSSADVLALQTT
jgi:hypothetical protein